MPSYVVRVRTRFEAAHHLRSYRGRPEPAHGHTWQVEAALALGGLDEEDMAVDFVRIRQALEELAGRFDHRDINTVPPFDDRSPTAENLAAWFHGHLEERLDGAAVAEVTVWEGPDCSVTYRP